MSSLFELKLISNIQSGLNAALQNTDPPVRPSLLHVEHEAGTM